MRSGCRLASACVSSAPAPATCTPSASSARRKARIVLDSRATSAAAAISARRRDDPLGVAFGAAREPHERARDVAGGKRGGEARREGVKIAQRVSGGVMR